MAKETTSERIGRYRKILSDANDEVICPIPKSKFDGTFIIDPLKVAKDIAARHFFYRLDTEAGFELRKLIHEMVEHVGSWNGDLVR